MKAAIIGYGRMGREIEAVLRARGHSVAAIIDRDNEDDLNAERMRGVDAALEFTIPGTAEANIRKCIDLGIPVVSGTTGWGDRFEATTAYCRAHEGALFYASNYSLGVNLLFRLNEELARLMSRFPQYDVRIDETHHIHKKDAPSGTAITLAEGIIASIGRKDGWVGGDCAPQGKIPVGSVREGEIAGIHTVTYESCDDRLELRHTIKNRRTLAEGAVIAAEFLCGKKGVYTMKDLLNASNDE